METWQPGRPSPRGKPQEAGKAREVAKSPKGSPPKPPKGKEKLKLLDTYKLGRQLGQGAFGVVYKCTRRDTGEEFAVKMIDQVETPLAEIEKEAEMLSKLRHPCVVRLHDVFYEKCFVCMVMNLYNGGDMIQGMMKHWNSKGQIPIAPVRLLTKQMWESIAFIHSRGVVHRDVKGDNFMMDMPDITAQNNRVYLSDFGTVREIAQGERLRQSCGTNNYWSPEFYKLNYGLKVDCWAVGIVMFGFFSAKFPFKNQEEVNKKKLVIPSRAGEDGVALCTLSLERDEGRRIEARQALSHQFIADIQGLGSVPEAGEEFENVKPEIKEPGANAGIAERRRELVARLQVAHGDIHEAALTQPQRKAVDAHTFVVTDPTVDRSLKYEWWEASKAAQISSAWKRCRRMSVVAENREVDTDSVGKLLADHNVSRDRFGKGQAKTYDQFVSEIRSGQSRLMIDATKYKHLVRVVDVVLLRIKVNIGGEDRAIIEVSETDPAGRVRNSMQLPGNKKLPHENTLQAALRIHEETLGLDVKDVTYDIKSICRSEQAVDSPSYPGVRTVYLKEVVTGKLNTGDPAVFERLGLGAGGKRQMLVRDAADHTRTYQWLSQAECDAKNMRGALSETEGIKFSPLVYPPIGLDKDELLDYLEQNKVDVSKWGQGTWKSIGEFSDELVKGEATLMTQADGQVVRVVDIVVLELCKETEDGAVLIEVEETAGRGEPQTRNRLPAIKRRSDEHQFAAARRLLTKFLCMDENAVRIDNTRVMTTEEQHSSTSYFGITTLYRKRFMRAVLQ